MSVPYCPINEAWPSESFGVIDKPKRKRKGSKGSSSSSTTRTAKRSSRDTSESMLVTVPAKPQETFASPPIEKKSEVKEPEETIEDSYEDVRYDLFLYVFSGLLLLFVLEQFLQVGIILGSAKSSLVAGIA